MEPKKLSLEEMKEIEGESYCGLAIIGLSAAIIGTGASLVTLNPFGTALGIAGIFTGGPSMLYACNLM